jgi:hypothetical protein
MGPNVSQQQAAGYPAITEYQPNTPLSTILTRDFSAPESLNHPTQKSAPALAEFTAKTDTSALHQSIAANICRASACPKANSRSQ